LSSSSDKYILLKIAVGVVISAVLVFVLILSMLVARIRPTRIVDGVKYVPLRSLEQGEAQEQGHLLQIQQWPKHLDQMVLQTKPSEQTESKKSANNESILPTETTKGSSEIDKSPLTVQSKEGMEQPANPKEILQQIPQNLKEVVQQSSQPSSQPFTLPKQLEIKENAIYREEKPSGKGSFGIVYKVI
jgi:hypothetical protein